MKELVITSPTRGAGRTTVAAGLAALAGGAVVADCGVGTTDLCAVLVPEGERPEDFRARRWVRVLAEACIGCARCAAACRFDAFVLDGPPNELVAKTYRVDAIKCEGCGECVPLCPGDGILIEEAASGRWLIGATRFGPMVRAMLEVDGQSPGHLVTLVRDRAQKLCQSSGHRLLIVDGPPATADCVVATILGATAVLVVVQPSEAGLEDLESVVRVLRHLRVAPLVCVNRWDLSPEMAHRIEARMEAALVPVVGRVRHDPAVPALVREGRSVVESPETAMAADIRALWQAVAPLVLY